MTPKNPFKLFNIPISLEISERHLEETFIKMQKEHHPDANNSDTQKSLEISESYHILKNDISRGEAILLLFEINQDTFPMPQDFFPQIMSITEEMRELPKTDAKKIALDAKAHIINLGKISKENINLFTQLFIKYKYLKKAFINAHGSW